MSANARTNWWTPPRYVVVWCDEIPLMPDGDGDLDHAHYTREVAKSFKHAVKLAKLIVARRDDAFGCPSIHEEERREVAPGDSVFRWETVGNLTVCDWAERCTLADFDRRSYAE